MFTALLRICLYCCLAYLQPGVYAFYTIAFVLSLCTLFENIISEYTLVLSSKRENELNPDKTANHLPIFFGFRSLGALIGTFFGGRIIKYYSIATAYSISSKIPLMVIIIGLFYREQEVNNQNRRTSWKEQVSIMSQLLFRDKVLQLIVFICLVNMTPNFDALYTFYMTDHLKFSTEDLANFSTFATVCYVLGLAMYSFWMKDINPRKFYLTTNFILWIVNISFLLVVLHIIEQWGLSNKLFCFFNQGAYSMINEMNFMPILAIWCGICPKNLEATSITLFTGLINFSNNLSNYFGALLIWVFGYKEGNFDKMWNLLVIQNSYLLIAIVGITFVEFPDPRNNPEEEKRILSPSEKACENGNIID